MLSEEEKQAIEGLKGSQKWIRQQIRLGNLPNYNQGHYADIQIALNLIEKQSKEIEELKLKIGDEKIFIKLGECIGEKKVKDKIKAKIEEVKDGTYDAKIVLQSLLEKE